MRYLARLSSVVPEAKIESLIVVCCPAVLTIRDISKATASGLILSPPFAIRANSAGRIAIPSVDISVLTKEAKVANVAPKSLNHPSVTAKYSYSLPPLSPPPAVIPLISSANPQA